MSAFASILNLYKILSVKRKIQGFICLSFILGSAISESIVIFSLSNFLLILSGGLNVSENNLKPLLFFLELNNNSLFYVSLIFIIAICISTIVRLFTAYLNAFYSAGISHDLSKAIYIKSLRTPYYKHINKNSSDLISLISTHLNQATETITYTLQLLTGLFATFSIVISLSTINLKILISIVFIFSLVYLILGLSVKKVLAKDSKIIAKSINKQINIAKESILNFKDVIIYNLFHSYTQSYVKTDL